MPRATAKYRFEWKILDWAYRFSQEITGETRGFIITLSPNGIICESYFGEQMNHAPQSSQNLLAANENWLFCDSFDAPELTWIAWKNLSQSIIEQLLAEPFDDDDFIDLIKKKPMETFPSSWGVMF